MNHGASTNEDRASAEIDEVVEQLLDGSSAAVHDVAWLQARFPRLMPDLGHRLQLALKLRNAAQKALDADSPSTPEPDPDDELQTLPEEFEFFERHLPRYTLIGVLGRGGQATVYEAIQQSTGRVVAVKILREGPLASPAQRARFQREVTLVAKLRHPNIVSIYESGLAAGHCWFSMECADSAEPIDQYLLLGGHTVRQVVELSEQVVRAVAFAHQQGVIHRDIKPSNLLVDRGGVPRVVDFGLAKDTLGGDASQQVSAQGLVVGTLAYMSPEQAAGRDDEVDIRTDIYSLGVVLYRLLAGDHPFPVSSAAEPSRPGVARAGPRRIAEIRATRANEPGLPAGEVDRDLEWIVLKAMEPDRERRYQSAIAMADDLARYLRGEAVEARSGESWYSLVKTLRRYRVQAGLAAAFVLVLAVSLGVVLHLWRKAEHVAQIAQAGLDAASYVALGSAARDEGRLDDAIGFFEDAIKISDMYSTADPMLLLSRYRACERLARLLYHKKDLLRADHFRDLAIAVASAGAAEFPADPRWSFNQMWLLSLDGIRADAMGNMISALENHRRARKACESLLERDSTSTMLRRSMCQLLWYEGSVLLKLEQHEEAFPLHKKGLEFATNLYEQHGRNLDDLLQTIRCHIKLAKCHLRRRTVQDNRDARSHLEISQQKLELARADSSATALMKIIEDLETDTNNYLQYLEKRERAMLDVRSPSGRLDESDI